MVVILLKYPKGNNIGGEKVNINELKAEIVRRGMNIGEFADFIGVSRTTMWRKINNPNTFTLADITKIREVLEIEGKRVIEIFFTDKVS